MNSGFELIKDIVLILVTWLITPYLDSFRARISKSFKEKYEQRKNVLENTVQFILNNPNEEIILRNRLNHQNTIILLGLFFGMVLTSMSNIVNILFGYLIILVSLYGNYRISRLQNIIYKINELKSKANPEIDLELYYRGKKKS
jgi:hypothetical protein